MPQELKGTLIGEMRRVGAYEVCVRLCPAGAYGEDGSYHRVWSMEKCEAKREELARNGYSVCNLCWDICPAGSYSHRDLFVMRITRSGPLSRVADWVGLIQEDAGIDVTPGAFA